MSLLRDFLKSTDIHITKTKEIWDRVIMNKLSFIENFFYKLIKSVFSKNGRKKSRKVVYTRYLITKKAINEN